MLKAALVKKNWFIRSSRVIWPDMPHYIDACKIYKIVGWGYKLNRLPNLK